MKTKYSIRLIILLTIIGIFISAFVTFGFIVIYIATTEADDFMGILVGLLFLWMGLGYLTVIIGKIKTIELRDGILILRKPFLQKSIEIELTRIKYVDFEWQMSWNAMRGILIKLDTGEVEQISINEYRNSKELIVLITKSCKRDETIKPTIWSRQLKVFLFIGLIIVTGFILLKLIK